jgi:hypothetical protein
MSEVRERLQAVFANAGHESSNITEHKVLEIVSPLIEENALFKARKPLSEQIDEYCKTACADETDECKRTKHCSLKSFLLWTLGCGSKRK